MRRRSRGRVNWSWQSPDLPPDDGDEVERRAMRQAKERYEAALEREWKNDPESAAAYKAECERILKERA
jgi:hypothetical protein